MSDMQTPHEAGQSSGSGSVPPTPSNETGQPIPSTEATVDLAKGGNAALPTTEGRTPLVESSPNEPLDDPSAAPPPSPTQLIRLRALLEEGNVEEFNRSRPSCRLDFAGIDLRGKTLDGVNLQNCNLSGSNLEDCSLQRANLSGAILRGVTAIRADLTEANLTAATADAIDLREAKLNKTNVSHIHAPRAVLSRASMVEAEGTGANFSYCQLDSAFLHKSKFYLATFTGSDLT